MVETHATPLREGRTAIVEATLATSERKGFAVARALRPALRPLMSWAAGRLWVEDAAYAERLYALRANVPARVTSEPDSRASLQLVRPRRS